jgi:hypothetical protein
MINDKNINYNLDKITIKRFNNHNKHDNQLDKIFFSEKNIAKIQQMIKIAVFKKTKGKYILETDQDVLDLYVVMKNVFLEHADFLPYDFDMQIKKLNNILIINIIPDIITNIKKYYGYIKDINNPRNTLDHPINVNHQNKKTLPSITSLWQI